MIVNLIFRKIFSKFARKEVDQEFPDRDGSVLSSIFVDFTRARRSEQIGGVPGRAIIIIVAIALACAIAIGGIGIAAADGSAEWQGEIEIEADPAEHGDSFEYEMGSVAEVDDPELMLTGEENTEWNNYTVDSDADGSFEIDVDGNAEADVFFEVNTQFEQTDTYSDDGDGGATFDISDYINPHLDDGSSIGVWTEREDDISYHPDAYLYDSDGNTLDTEDASNVIDTWSGSLEYHPDAVEIQIDPSTVDSVGIDVPVYEISDQDYTVEHDGETLLDYSGEIDSDNPIQSDSFTLDPGTTELDFSEIDSQVVDIDVYVKETTKTANAEVELNDEQIADVGSLDVDETETIPFDPDIVQEGTNEIDVSVAEGLDGPTGQVSLDYQHSAIDSQTVDYEAETFSERHNVSKEWGQDVDDAELRVPWASDRVIDIRGYQVYVDDEPVDYNVTTEGGELVADLGAMDAGQSAQLVANGTKVQTEGGEIRVTDPTLEGKTLDTGIEVIELTDELEISVEGTYHGDQLHYLSEAGWESEDYSVVSDSENALVMPEAAEGSYAWIQTAPLSIEPDAGSVEVEIIDGSEPRFSIDGVGAAVSVEYDGGTPGYMFQMVDVMDNVIDETDIYEDSAAFEITQDSTYLIEEYEADQAGLSIPIGGSSLDIPAEIALAGIITVAVVGFGVAASRRDSITRRETIIGGISVSFVGAIGLELVTARSIAGMLIRETMAIPQTVIDRSFDAAGSVFSWFGDLIADLLSAGAASGILPLIVAIGLFIVLAVFQDRTEVEVPVPVLVASGGLVLVWFLEVLAPGMMMSALQSGLEEVGPLVWLVILAGGGTCYH